MTIASPKQAGIVLGASVIFVLIGEIQKIIRKPYNFMHMRLGEHMFDFKNSVSTLSMNRHGVKQLLVETMTNKMPTTT